MIFAELQYEQSYAAAHAPLVALLRRHFPNVEAGLQGDSWVWVLDLGQRPHRVAVDTFTSARHQVKSTTPSALVDRVLSVLALEYEVSVFEPPIPEAHDEAPTRP